MTVTDDKLQHHRLRAPATDGEVFVDPPAEQVAHALAENLAARESAAHGDYDLQGRRLGDLVSAARGELLTAAHRYTSGYRDGLPAVATSDAGQVPIILSGHQPEMFHPGVWAKHFAADHLAARHGGLAVALLIDSDVARHSSLGVPGGTVERPIVEAVPFDAADLPVPVEEIAHQLPAIALCDLAALNQAVDDALDLFLAQGQCADPGQQDSTHDPNHGILATGIYVFNRIFCAHYL